MPVVPLKVTVPCRAVVTESAVVVEVLVDGVLLVKGAVKVIFSPSPTESEAGVGVPVVGLNVAVLGMVAAAVVLTWKVEVAVVPSLGSWAVTVIVEV